MQSYSSSEVFLKIRSVRILDSIGSNRWFGCSLRLGMPLNSPARRPSSSVSCSLTSDNGRAPGRMLDTLLPIPDAEYPAFYPIGIKARCVCRGGGGGGGSDAPPAATAMTTPTHGSTRAPPWTRPLPTRTRRQPTTARRAGGCGGIDTADRH